VIRVVLRLEKRMKDDQKGVIYCRSKKKCESLAEKLGCDFYHAGIEDEKVRYEIFMKWVNGTGGNRWVVATTALGTGVDVGGIVGIVHMEQPYGLVDFVQQTGRGGRREGEVVESVIVMDQKKAWQNEESSDVEQLNHQAIEWFVNSVDCRRVTLGMFMDGNGLDCEEIGGEQCDRCRRRTEEIERMEEEEKEKGEDEDVETLEFTRRGRRGEVERSNRLKKHTKDGYIGLKRLREWLEAVERGCGVCYVKWHQHGKKEEWKKRYKHGVDGCKVIKKEEFLEWRKGVRFGDYGCCWRCGLPQIWCQEFGRLGCEHMDKVIPVMMMVGLSKRLRQIVLEEFEIDVAEKGEYVRWIGRSRRIYGEDMTNGLGVWDLIVRKICV
jgi:superfamily II DNA/RNA helicase